MVDRRYALVIGSLAALSAALGAYDNAVLGGVTVAGGWTDVAVWTVSAGFFLLMYASPRARSLFGRVCRTRPAQAVLALVGLCFTGLALWLVADFVRTPPSEVEAVIAVAFWVVVFGGAGASVLTAVYHGPEPDTS